MKGKVSILMRLSDGAKQNVTNVFDAKIDLMQK